MAIDNGDRRAMEYQSFKDAINDLAHKDYWVFRGQSRCNWGLKSSLARYCERNKIDYRQEPFSDMLSGFVEQAADFVAKDLTKLSLCEKIALAQHHGIPTPFLDWTKSPYIACFFAVSDKARLNQQEPIRIWALRTDNLPGTVTDIPSIGDLFEKRFYFIRTQVFQSRRIHRQMGCFSTIGESSCQKVFLEKQKGELCNRLRFFDISTSNWNAIVKDLRLMGIGAATLMDSLDGVADDVIIDQLSSLQITT